MEAPPLRSGGFWGVSARSIFPSLTLAGNPSSEKMEEESKLPHLL